MKKEKNSKKILWLLEGVMLFAFSLVSAYSFSQSKEKEELVTNSAKVEEGGIKVEKQEAAGGTELAEEGLKEEISPPEEKELTEEGPLEFKAEELDLEVPEELKFIELEEKPEAEKKEIEAGRVNLVFKDAEITNVLAALAQQTGMNIIWGDEVKGIVTLRLENVPWDQALDMVLKANKLTYEKKENIIRVTTVERLNEEKAALLKLEEAEKEKEPLVTEIITLNFSDAKEVKESLAKVLSKRGNIVVDTRTNSLVITEIPSNLPEVKRVAQTIDTQTPQVMIEARIVETSATLVQDLGIDWAVKGTKFVPTHYKGANLDPILDKLLGPDATEEERREKRLEISHKGGSFESQFPSTSAYDGTAGYGGLFKLGVLEAYDFEIAWQLLESDTDTKILSNPRVATLHRRDARILVGEKIPIQKSEVTQTGTSYTVEYQDVGTTITVAATINKEDMVTLRVHPEVSEIGEWKQLATGEYPIIKTKEADVEVLVKSGDTVVIGGLIYEKEVKTVSKIPVLGNIPVVGWAFKKQKKEKADQEILVFVTPTVFGKKEKEEMAKELISFEEKEGVEIIEKGEKEKAFEEIEKELKEIGEEEKLEEEIPEEETINAIIEEVPEEKAIEEQLTEPIKGEEEGGLEGIVEEEQKKTEPPVE